MKITANPLGKLIEDAEMRTGMHFAPTTRDLADECKRQMAVAVLGGAEPSAEFVEAAAIESLDAGELAALIVSKPSRLMARENERRTLVVKLRAATAAADVEALLDQSGVRPRPR